MRNFSRSFSYLTLARGLQFGVPLLLYPILIGRIGLELFGYVVFWASVATFISKVAGMNIETYSSREIRRLEEVAFDFNLAFAAPVLLKLVSAVVIFFPWILLSLNFSSNSYQFLCILFSFHPMVLSTVTPTHYILGKGRFDVQFIGLLIEKSVLLISCYILLKSESDYWRVPIIYMCSSLLSCVWFWWMTKKYYTAVFSRELVHRIRRYISVGIMLTLGKITQLHTNAAKVIVGMVFDYSIVGAYDVAEKIVNILKVPISMVGQMQFSFRDHTRASYIVFLSIEVVVAALLMLSAFFLGKYALLFLLKDEFENWIYFLLLIQSVVLFPTLLVVVFGTNIVALYDKAKVYSRLMLIANAASILLLFLWYVFYRENILAFSLWVVLSEMVFGVLCLIRGLKIFKRNFL